MRLTIEKLGEYDFMPKVIKVANGYVCDIDKNGSVTSTWDEKDSIKVYNNVNELLADVTILVNNEDIFTVEPIINVDVENNQAEA